MGLTPSRPVTRSEHQDELVKMILGGIVIRRPKTNPDGSEPSEVVCRTGYEFPSTSCDEYVKDFCKAMQSGPAWKLKTARYMIRDFCGLDGSATSRNSVEQN